jgi:hypothetical protein
MRSAAHGISIDAPSGWEVRIFRREGAMPVMHLASFPLSHDDGDFGAAATARMAPGDAFAALVEYRPDDLIQAGAGLFARTGLPRLRAAEFSPAQLQVTRVGQLGVQRFSTENGRPSCLYCVVWPAQADDARIVKRLGAVLRTLQIG